MKALRTDCAVLVCWFARCYLHILRVFQYWVLYRFVNTVLYTITLSLEAWSTVLYEYNLSSNTVQYSSTVVCRSIARESSPTLATVLYSRVLRSRFVEWWVMRGDTETRRHSHSSPKTEEERRHRRPKHQNCEQLLFLVVDKEKEVSSSHQWSFNHEFITDSMNQSDWLKITVPHNHSSLQK